MCSSHRHQDKLFACDWISESIRFLVCRRVFASAGTSRSTPTPAAQFGPTGPLFTTSCDMKLVMRVIIMFGLVRAVGMALLGSSGPRSWSNARGRAAHTWAVRWTNLCTEATREMTSRAQFNPANSGKQFRRRPNHTLHYAHTHYWPQVATCCKNWPCRSTLGAVRWTNLCTKVTREMTPRAQFNPANSGKHFKRKPQLHVIRCTYVLLTSGRNLLCKSGL